MKNKTIVLVVIAVFALALSGVVVMQIVSRTSEGKQDAVQVIVTAPQTTPVSRAAAPSNVTDQPIASIAPTEFTNEKFHYSFAIPDGWRIYKASADSFDVLYLTNLKETDPVDKILGSMITIKAVHNDKASVHPPIGQPIVVTNRTYETSKTTSGIEMVYTYLTEGKKPLAGNIVLKAGPSLKDGTSANLLLIQFPLSPDTVVTDAQARSLLMSLRLLP
jgi:hypothetical protein